MIIKNNDSSNFITRHFGKHLKFRDFEDCSTELTKKILENEKPDLVYARLFKPVNGDNDVVTMISSICVNTRLRVIIINTEQIKEYFTEALMNFLPGRKQHKLDTP